MVLDSSTYRGSKKLMNLQNWHIKVDFKVGNTVNTHFKPSERGSHTMLLKQGCISRKVSKERSFPFPFWYPFFFFEVYLIKAKERPLHRLWVKEKGFLSGHVLEVFSDPLYVLISKKRKNMARPWCQFSVANFVYFAEKYSSKACKTNFDVRSRTWQHCIWGLLSSYCDNGNQWGSYPRLSRLTFDTPHFGSLTLIRSYSNCKSSANLASKSMQNPEQHLMSSVKMVALRFEEVGL